jgi:hypothetical protein
MPLAPEAQAPDRPASTAERDGDLLKVPVLCPVLPDRCVVCGEPARGIRVARHLNRFGRPNNPWMLGVILILNWWALFFLWPVIVDFGMCSAHLRRMRRKVTLCTVGAVIAFVAFWAAFLRNRTGLGLLFFATSAVLGVAASRAYHVLRLRRRDEHHAWLVVPKRFLDALP